MSLCGHTSIIALFRFELQNIYLLNYILLTYYLLRSHERVCTQIAHRQQTDIPHIVSLTDVLVSHSSCRHLSARSGNPTFSRQHTNSMCVDIGTQYPHKHHATFTLFPKSNILNSIKNCDLFSPSRRLSVGFNRRLAPRLARWVKQELMALRVSLVL